jgi:hypothetical protein
MPVIREFAGQRMACPVCLYRLLVPPVSNPEPSPLIDGSMTRKVDSVAESVLDIWRLTKYSRAIGEFEPMLGRGPLVTLNCWELS